MKILKKCLEKLLISIVFIVYTLGNIFMHLLGYKRIEEIKIPAYNTRPKEKSIETWKMFYREFQRIPAIIVDNKNFLIDGFSIYIAAYEMDFEYIKVMRVKKRKCKSLKKQSKKTMRVRA